MPTSHNLSFSLDSTATITVEPEALNANDSDTINVSITWPDGNNTISCTLAFNSTSQDPFNDAVGGQTTFSATRSNSSSAATHTLVVENDATWATDTYDVSLTIDGETYTTDPTIIVGDDPT